MPLLTGTRLGPYELLGQIGAGGMGVVYNAKDARLGREVAIKLLPKAFAEDVDRLRRFEQEAKTLGNLNHPNILSVFDVGSFEGQPYLVMERLLGETLRGRIAGKALTTKKAMEIALQIAQGLSAAHERGIIHRDLKPDNIFLTREGRVKILDFGLAKPAQDQIQGSDSTRALNMPILPGTSASFPHTAPGTVVGTAGYMSPEQVRGERLDGRSDLFCLGLMLWEMLTGRHPFHGDSAIEIMYAILRDEPPELDPDLHLPLLLERVVQRCLAKQPSDRFQSAHDLAFALEAASQSSFVSMTELKSAPVSSTRSKRSGWWIALGTVGALGLAAMIWLFWHRALPAPNFKRLTFAPGLVDAARFSADGRSIFFTARFQGRKPELFVQSPESPEPRPVDTGGFVLLDISSNNQLAVLRETHQGQEGYRGILAEMPGGGGSFRDLQEDVLEAAWDEEGGHLAVITLDKGFNSCLEYPSGHVLHSSAGELKLLRMGPGNRMALVEGTGGRTDIVVFQPRGQSRILFSKGEDVFAATLTGLAWHPSGKALWFSENQGSQSVFWTLSMNGKRSMVWRGPGDIRLMDIAPDGRVLATVRQTRKGVFYQRAGQTALRDLSILDGTQAVGFTPDGASLLMLESPSLDGGTTQDLAYLRSVEGSSVVRLAKGYPRSLSTDGRMVGMSLSNSEDAANVLTFVPTGAGQTLKVEVPGNFDGLDDAVLFDQERKVLFAGMQKGQDWQFYTLEREGGTPKAFTPVGIRAPRPLLLSPDGKFMIGTTTTRGQYARYALEGGDARPIRGMQPGETPIAWTQDGRGICITGAETDLPVRIFRLDPDTGQRSLLHSFMPPDTAGYLGTPSVRTNTANSAFAFTYDRRISDLYLIEGMK